MVSLTGLLHTDWRHYQGAQMCLQSTKKFRYHRRQQPGSLTRGDGTKISMTTDVNGTPLTLLLRPGQARENQFALHFAGGIGIQLQNRSKNRHVQTVLTDDAAWGEVLRSEQKRKGIKQSCL